MTSNKNCMNAKEIISHMESLQNDEQRSILMKFFKTGPGQYGEGDEFLGLKVPQTREVVSAVGNDLPLSEVPELLARGEALRTAHPCIEIRETGHQTTGEQQDCHQRA